jgi:hypothetical protein
MRRRLSRLSRFPSARRAGVAALVLLLIGGVVLSAAPVSGTVPGAGRRSAAVTARRRAAGHAPRGASAVSPAGLARARTVAGSFAESYLAVAYGRASVGSVTGVTPAFRLELAREQPVVTPIERERHPRVVSVEAVGQAPGFVLATAWVSDGGISTYALRFTVREGPGGWLVSDVLDG